MCCGSRFRREIAPARTFGFVEEIRALENAGLGQGAHAPGVLGDAVAEALVGDVEEGHEADAALVVVVDAVALDVVEHATGHAIAVRILVDGNPVRAAKRRALREWRRGWHQCCTY